MPTFAKTLIAAISAAAVTANLVSRAHGWGNVDWTPIATAWAGVVAIYAYPNTKPAPSTPTAPPS